MADDIIVQITPHIHEILRIVLVKGRTLRELNELVGKTIQNYHVEIEGEEDASRPICVEFKHLRRSGRLAPTKRTYEKMQTNTGTGRPAKKPKLADDNAITDALPTNGVSKEPATHDSTSETAAETSANPPANGKSATSEPAINRSYIDITNTAAAPESYNAADLPTSATQFQIEGGKILSLSPKGDMFPMTHGDGLTILDEYFEQSAIGSGPVNNADELDKGPTFMAESIYQDEALEPTDWSNIPGALTTLQHPPIADINTVSSEASDILDPDLTATAAMSESSDELSTFRDSSY